MLRFFVVSSLLVLAGCECVSVPPRDYACVNNDDCDEGASCVSRRCELPMVDAGQPDAGAPDAGVPDAGTPDAGVTDAGFDAGSPEDAGVNLCNTWSCVEALWPEPVAFVGGVNGLSAPLPADLDGGSFGWFGGVLLPDGRVLAVAHTSESFVLLNPATHEVTRFGEPLQAELLADGTWRRFYAGGVLHPNGKVYVFPYHAFSVIEIDLTDGSRREVGPTLKLSDGGFPRYVGGVVDRFGFIWTVSESSDEPMPVLRFDPDAGTSSLFHVPTGRDDWGGWWGMARLPDDRLLAFPKEASITKHLSPYILAIEPQAPLTDAFFSNVADFNISTRDGGFSMQGGSLTRSGSVCGAPAGIETRLVCVNDDTGPLRATMVQTTIDTWGFSGTFSDGVVWTAPDVGSIMARIDESGVRSSVTTVASVRYGYLGVVATPQGLVLIPGVRGSEKFVIVKPGDPINGVWDQRPMPVLLSPYFNKL